MFEELVSPDAVDHSGPTALRGVEGFTLRTRAVQAAFSNASVAVEDLLIDGDRIAWRWTLTATHTGPFICVAPTKRLVTMTGINIQRIALGVVVEHWSNQDQLGLLRQVEAP